MSPSLYEHVNLGEDLCQAILKKVRNQRMQTTLDSS